MMSQVSKIFSNRFVELAAPLHDSMLVLRPMNFPDAFSSAD